MSEASARGRAVRVLFVGALASGLDFAVLYLLVDLLGFSPSTANLPSLLAGAAVQFCGCRYYVFPVESSARPPLVPQLLSFGVTEAGALVLNAVAFQAFVTFFAAPYLLARLVGQVLVFVLFSFPIWTRIFRARPA